MNYGLKHSLHSEERMQERFISQQELDSCLTTGKVVQKKLHEKTGNRVWVLDLDIKGCTLRTVVDLQWKQIVSVYYRRTKYGCRPENEWRMTKPLA